jgi:ATP-binding cassette subfamily B multidrug efflux pump
MAGEDDILIEEAFTQTRMTKSLLSRLYRYVKPYQQTFVLNLVFTLLATASQLLGPKFVQLGIDRYLSGGLRAEAAFHGIMFVSGIYLLNLSVGWLLSVVQVKTAVTVGQGAMNDLRLHVFEHIQRLSLNYFDKTHQGRIISRADSDIESLDRILTWGANQLLSSALTLIGVIAVLLGYDWRLCLAVSVVIPPLAVATRWFQTNAMAAYRRMRETSSRITGALAENISGVRVVQAYSREVENLSRFIDLHEVYADRALIAARVFHTYMPFVGLVSGLGTAIILGYGSQRVMHRDISVGQLTAFVMYLGMFFGPIQTMGDLYNALLSTAASAERIFQLLDTDPQIQDRPLAGALPELRGEVEFEGVWFRYDGTRENEWVLKNVSFKARAGETIALVGATGSGKTSIISLLARFYEPQKGRILLDGIDLGASTMASLRSQIGIVTQENFLFSGTVMDNLKFGKPGASKEEVIDSARMLGTHEMILGLQNGYDTVVSERGGNFSAGQRQLLTFTRAMVARPKILILDEATSSVDQQTEKVLQHALEKLFEQRTSFVIAHRLSTIRHANLILVLGHGEVLERGTHGELIAKGGAYARLNEEFMRHSLVG